MNRLNQKGTRPEDVPTIIGNLSPEEQAMIKTRYPVLVTEDHHQRIK
jgi:hypothetical protein